jgi:hypothetical protein
MNSIEKTKSPHGYIIPKWYQKKVIPVQYIGINKT